MKVLCRSLVGISLVLGLVSSLPAFAVEHSAETSAQHVAPSSAVNINTADAEAIINAHIKGIGKKRAQAIVAYRQTHGPFKSLDDLKKIKGLNGKVIDANRDRLVIN